MQGSGTQRQHSNARWTAIFALAAAHYVVGSVLYDFFSSTFMRYFDSAPPPYFLLMEKLEFILHSPAAPYWFFPPMGFLDCGMFFLNSLLWGACLYAIGSLLRRLFGRGVAVLDDLAASQGPQENVGSEQPRGTWRQMLLDVLAWIFWITSAYYVVLTLFSFLDEGPHGAFAALRWHIGSCALASIAAGCLFHRLGRGTSREAPASSAA